MTTPITLIQLTDTHLVPMSISRLRGFPTRESLEAVLSVVQTHQPDYLLLTGDLADAGDWQAYQQLADLIRPLQIPTLWLPGNHDLEDRLCQTLRESPFDGRKAVTIGGWRLLLLNSVITTSCVGMGELSADTLVWLQQHLQDMPTMPTLVALHHHPVPTGIDWLDQISLQNAEEFYAAIAPFPHVKIVVFGHIHQDLYRRHRQVDYYGCPSTCTQVAIAGSPQESICLDQPGFRWFRLCSDGSYTTGVERVAFSPR